MVVTTSHGKTGRMALLLPTVARSSRDRGVWLTSESTARLEWFRVRRKGARGTVASLRELTTRDAPDGCGHLGKKARAARSDPLAAPITEQPLGGSARSAILSQAVRYARLPPPLRLLFIPSIRLPLSGYHPAFCGSGTTRRYGFSVFQPPGNFSRACSSLSEGTMMTSSPLFQSAGVATL